MEKKQKTEAEINKPKIPFISKRSKKLAEQHALKTSQIDFSPKEFSETQEETVKKSSFHQENLSSAKTIKTNNVEYTKNHDFIINILKNK